MPMLKLLYQILFFCIVVFLTGFKSPGLTRLNVISELYVGESKEIELINGEKVNLELLEINILRDSPRSAIRAAQVKIAVNGEVVSIGSGNYNLPVTVGSIKIDCPLIKEHTVSNYYRHGGGLNGDARFRLWPEDSPYIQPGTFSYPLKQVWFASRMQSQNELAGLGWAENLQSTPIGYHPTHDFGGAEGMDEIIAAAGGLVVSSNNEVLEGYEDLPGDVRPDVIWIVDGRGWYYRYSHLDSIEPDIVPGARIGIGELLGLMGKQGGSGGWVHLHFGVHYKEPGSSVWEVEDAYPYLWEAYVEKYKPALVAVARPRLLAWTGEDVILNGTKSISLTGDIVSYEWVYTDGAKAYGAVQKRKYDEAGEYSEILKVTDSNGNVDYDFAYIQVYDKEDPEKPVPTIHPVFYPSLNIRPGNPVTFLVRTFGSSTGEEVWDFGDGSEKVIVNSGVVQRESQNEGEYAKTVHSFSRAGQYVVRVERTSEHGLTAIGHLHVVVNQ
jgi:murein DD-endopeptidase MepM/ murein hydrolase activator NlpD